jgi:hypothetical protein
MLPHYVRVHGYKPPQHFVDLVMAGALVPKNYYSIENGEQVGYLEGPFETGSVPEAFLQRLDDVLLQAEFFGGRQQTKG